MGNDLNIMQQVDEYTKDLPDYNYALGRTLMQPFKPANSGSRALMYSIHTEQHMVLNNAEVPIIQTGYETEFGRKSNSYVENDKNLKILFKINKFDFTNKHYYLIVQDVDTGMYDVIERVSYNYNTESYGFWWNNERLDNLKVGDILHNKDVIKTSIGFDEYTNKMNGVNLLTLYLSCAQNMEDSVIISETAAKKLETVLVKNNSISINDNDILLDLYGSNGIYKTFPNIGEEVKDGVFCAIRRIENDNILFTMSQSNLRDTMLSDRNITMDGIVADINVFTNNPEALTGSRYNEQLLFYYNQYMNFCRQVNDIVGPLAMTESHMLSYELKKLYGTCRDAILGKGYFDSKQFNHVIMEVTTVQALPMCAGDKMSDRYGGKGVVSQILPDEMMPMLDNGKRVEVVKNQSTCINRENIGQLNEQSLSFIGMRILDYFKLEVLSATEKCYMWYDFVNMVDPAQANFFKENVNFDDEFEAKVFIDSLFEDDGIILSIQPFTTTINIDTLSDIYRKFSWIKQYKVKVPMVDSNGNVRMVQTRRPMSAGKIYHYRLKQYAEEKFSVTSLSATNLKNLNTRSKANKMYEAKFTKTPIMFGFMEAGDMMHLGVQYVVMLLMLYSSSPLGRRLTEQLLTGDPYNIDIRLDHQSKNRNAEIINALMETMGLELVFNKIPKKRKQMVLNVMAKVVPPSRFAPKTNIRDIMGRFDELPMMYNAAMTERQSKNPLCLKVMCKKVGDDENDGNRKPEDDIESSQIRRP